MSVHDILYHPVSGKTNNLLLFVAALVPAFVFFPFPASVYANGIDLPLAWVFNFLVCGNLAVGKDIIFPHGPLAFLMYPLPQGPNLWIAISVHLVLRIFMAYSLLKLATRKPAGFLFFALLSACILLTLNDILLTIVEVIILCYLNFFERRNILWILPALIITPVAIYIKAFAGIVSFVITISFACIMIYRSVIGLESRFRLLLFLIVPFVLVAVWLALYGERQGFTGYLRGMAMLAADNSAAAAVYPLNNWWVTGTALACSLLLFVINVKNTTLARYSILAAPALFAIWKYGMAREDFLHTSLMFIFILFGILIFNILAGKPKLINYLLSTLIVVLFYFTLQKSYYCEPFRIRFDGLNNLVVNAIGYRHFSDTCNLASEKAICRNTLDTHILEMIGNHTVDVYPWDYTYIAANHLNWQPRPVIQSYASYTYELDELNATHFESERAPDFIIWELRKITHDIHGGTLESIDGRYLLNDEPKAFLSMLRNYEFAARQNGLFPALVFKKRRHAFNCVTTSLGQVKTTWNTWVDVPANSTAILRASVGMKRSFTGRIKSFLYKDEATFVYYLLANGDIRMYRIVPKNAAYGLWINPLILDPQHTGSKLAVTKIMFRCSNTAMMKDEIDLRWNKLDFLQTENGNLSERTIPDPVYQFFGITHDTLHAELFLSKNDLESNPAFWSSPDSNHIVVTGDNRSYLLSPGNYSVSFQFPLDSLRKSKAANLAVVRAGVWAKTSSAAKAVYVISIEKDGKSLSWKAVDIEDFIHDYSTTNFVTNYSILGSDILDVKGLMIKVYAWNTGKESILLDDFTVRIEN